LQLALEFGNIPWEMGPGEDNSLIISTQGIKGIGQFSLRFLFAAEKLHFLQKKYVTTAAVFFLESFHAPLFNSDDHLIGKFLGGEIENTGVSIVG
jgi:hypothetical protein